MKKISTTIAILFTGFFSSVVQAIPQKDTWYIGAKSGWSKYFNADEHDYTYLTNDGVTHTNALANNLFLSYQINPILGFELGLDKLGNIKYSGENISGNFKSYDLQLSAKFSYPFSDKLDIYSRLGGMLWYVNADHFTLANNNSFENTDISFVPFIAAGMEYSINRDIAIRLDYQFVNTIGDKYIVGSKPKNGILSFGVSYKFGHKPYSAIKVNTQKKSVNDTKYFKLKNDVLFNFNKFILKNEGKQTLDQLYKDLNFNKQKNTVMIIGFTDRIGSIKYNQGLAKKRAQSVLNYLARKGIPSNEMSISSIGKSYSITKNKCNNIKKRKSLIECLAPDRRVEIKIQVIKNINANLNA
ncbi:porin OmpA [Candidatus Pantoea edessiphila]|uniref:Outer membrane protein A n=1 Tax=Candidatus Pantoea edessiphila TaxID=2044610 RepID=A0A2P5T0K4_9GAMM|nr:porin OmpA [Candidatus Pantoea edessiphila]PPI88096.1 porin OmpA [Candidatus Pantoea edessiphila]